MRTLFFVSGFSLIFSSFSASAVAGDFSAIELLTPEDVFTVRAQNDLDLDQLSDEELIALYEDVYEESVREQTLDESRLVAQGRLLLELGYSYGYDRDEFDFTYQQHIYPRFQMRYSLTDRFELRAGWAGFTTETVTDELFGGSQTDTRVVDPTLGFRYLIAKQQGIRPQLAATVTTPFSLDSDHSFLSRLNPQAGLAYSYQLSPKWFIYGSTGAIWTEEGSERFLDLQQSAGVTWLFSERWSTSLDWYGVFPEGARFDGMEHYLIPGLQYSITPQTQLGFETSFGLTEYSPDVVARFNVTSQF